MPSPFPGMDPFIEMEEWGDFHHAMIGMLKYQLVAQLAPKYIVWAERHVYLENWEDDELAVLRPDVYISDPRESSSSLDVTATTMAAIRDPVTIEPEIYRVPTRVEHQEPYLTIRDTKNREVVAVIEFLSPGNKRRGSGGHRSYQERREKVLASKAQLIEIDLLRSGERPATTRKLRPTTDYCAMVHRVSERPKVEVYQWPLRHVLPEIPVPLGEDEPDARLDLQQALTSAFDSSGYIYQLPYREPLQPAVRESDVEWLQQILRNLSSAPQA